MKNHIVIAVACVLSLPAMASNDLIKRYEDACGLACAKTIEELSEYAAKQCGLNYDRVVEQSVELTGMQFVAMATAVGHPLATTLQNYAVQSLDCEDMSGWSKGIEDYALVLEANNGMAGTNVN